MIPSSTVFDESVMAQLLAYDPLVQDYRTFFALFDWSSVDAGETAPGGADALVILAVPISKPSCCASSRACAIPRNCGAFCFSIPCW